MSRKTRVTTFPEGLLGLGVAIPIGWKPIVHNCPALSMAIPARWRRRREIVFDGKPEKPVNQAGPITGGFAGRSGAV
jgi:hypothetical protein